MASDMDRLIALESAKLKRSRDIEAPYWLQPIASAIANIPIQRQKAAMWKRNTLNEQAASIPELAKMIRNKDQLDNFVKVSTNISNEMSENPDLTPQANIIKEFTANISNDYDMYTTSMEQGAKFVDDPNFITDREGWDDLENTVANMKLEDGKTKKYQGNGSFLYLTDQNDKISSIISRIQNSSQGTQFRYNKAGNKYTDAEMIEKLTRHQKQIGVAMQASMGDGIITSDEAESIMLGDLKAYQDRKSGAIKRIDREYTMLDKLQGSLSKEARALVGKDAVPDIGGLVKKITDELNTIQGDEDYIDTDISATTPDDIMEQLRKQIKVIHGQKDRLKASYKAWEGRDFRELSGKEKLPGDADIWEESDLGPSLLEHMPVGTGVPHALPEEEELVYSPLHEPKEYKKEDGADVDGFIEDWKDKVAIGAAGAYGLYQVSKGSIDYMKTALKTAEESKIAGFLQSPDAQRETQKIHSVIDRIKKLSPDDPNYSAKKQTYTKRIGKLASEFAKKHGHKFDASKDDIVKLMKNADKWNIWRIKNTVGAGMRQTYRTGEDLLKVAGKGGVKISPLTGALMGWHLGEKLDLGTAGKVVTAYAGIEGSKRLVKKIGEKGWGKVIDNPKLRSKLASLVINKAPKLGLKIAGKTGVGVLTAGTGVGTAVSGAMALWTLNDIRKIIQEVPQVKQLLIDFTEGKFDEE